MVKLIEMPGMKRPVRAAEWKDAESAVKRILKEERKFLLIMANL